MAVIDKKEVMMNLNMELWKRIADGATEEEMEG